MDFIRRINNFFSITHDPFSLSKKDQEALLNLYNNPKDLIERSYFQFRVQFERLPFYKRYINNLFGFFAAIYFIFISIIQKKEKGIIKEKSSKKKAIFPYKNYHYPDVIPTEVLNEFDIEKINFMSGFKYGFTELSIILSVWVRYPSQLYFLSKCISKILFYNYIIKNYTPDAIIASSEYSFTSSIATYYCRKNNTKHINITHGEHFYFIRDSFFEFDKFYVWDKYYSDLFIKLKASPSQFLVGHYQSLKMNIKKSQEKYIYTYYLASEDDAQLLRIKDTLEKIDTKNNICIRFHPRYSSEDSVQKIFQGYNIENPKEISLEESFGLTHNIMSLYSACMTQAHFNNKSVVIDDVSHPKKKLELLRELEYLIFSKPHKLASAILREKNKTKDKHQIKMAYKSL